MAIYHIPKNPGKQFKAIKSRAGTPIVTNGKNGKDKVFIPCKDERMAQLVIQKLASGDHDGEVWA